MLRKIPSSIPRARATSPAREGFLIVIVNSCPNSLVCGVSERRGVALTGADAHGLIEVEHEDLAVADLAGLGRSGDGADDLVDLLVFDADLDLDLRQKAHGVFGAAVDLGVAL